MIVQVSVIAQIVNSVDNNTRGEAWIDIGEKEDVFAETTVGMIGGIARRCCNYRFGGCGRGLVGGGPGQGGYLTEPGIVLIVGEEKVESVIREGRPEE